MDESPGRSACDIDIGKWGTVLFIYKSRVDVEIYLSTGIVHKYIVPRFISCMYLYKYIFKYTDSICVPICTYW